MWIRSSKPEEVFEVGQQAHAQLQRGLWRVWKGLGLGVLVVVAFFLFMIASASRAW
jgi:hypothetical protein